MDISLARNWWLFALRGGLAILFGILVFFWPEAAWIFVVASFGAYALVDGIFALVSAFSGQRGDTPRWALVLEGIIGLLAGIGTLVYPGLTAFALLLFIAYWSIATGIMQVIAAVRFSRAIPNAWLLGLGGVLSVVFGIALLLMPVEGALAVAWLIGAYSIAFGVLLSALGLHLRSLYHDRSRYPASSAPA